MAVKKRRSGNKKNSKADVVVVDFGEMVEGEGGGKRYREGDYLGKIIAAKRDVSSQKGSPCIKLTIQFQEGKYKGNKIVDRLWLSPKALPRLADLLEVLGVKRPKSEIAIPLKKLIGKTIGFSIEDEEGQDDKMRSKVGWDYLSPDDVGADDDDDDDDDEDDDDLDEDEDEDEDEDDDEDEDEDEDDEDEEDLDDMDRDELKAYIKANKLDIKVTKKMKDSKIRKLIEAEEEDEDDDEDEDEDDLESLDLEDL